MNISHKKNMVFRPTVVIGLGGTGYRTLLRLKKHLIESFGTVPSCISLLSIDVTEPENEDIEMEDGTRLLLDPNKERVVIQVPNPANLAEDINPHILEWWPENTLVAAIRSGATQIRPRGRLALFAKYEEVLERIRKAVEKVTTAQSLNDVYKMGWRRAEQLGIEVYIVNSVAGGTGSGMALDIAFNIRKLVHQDSNITGMLVLPRIFNSDPGIRQKPNSYAALKEIEFFMKIKKGEQYIINYGDAPLRIDKPPFDLLFLVDALTERRTYIKDREELFAVIAEALYVQIGSQIGTRNNNVLDNIRGSLSAVDQIYGRSASYCSFGIGSIILDKAAFEQSYMEIKKKAAMNLLNEMLNGSTSENVPPDGALNLIGEFTRDEEFARHMVERLLHVKGSGKLNFQLVLAGLPQERSRILPEIQTRFARKYEEMRRVVANAVDANGEDLSKELKEKLNYWFETNINLPGGLNYSLAMANKLIPAIERCKQLLSTNHNGNSGNEGGNTRFDLEKQMQRATRTWRYYFGGRGNLGTLSQSYRTVSNQELESYPKSEGAKKALEILDILRAELENVLRVCKELKRTLIEVNKNVAVELGRPPSEAKNNNPFEIVLPVTQSDLLSLRKRIDPIEFIKFCKEQYQSMSKLANTKVPEIASNLNRFVDNYYGEVAVSAIEDVLDKMEPHRLASVFNLLSELSAPLWCYDDSRMPLPHETIKETCCIGVRDADDTILKQHEENVGLGKSSPSYISLVDSNRITMFTIKAGVPLFALEGMDDMEHSYYKWSDISSNHIDQRWKWFPDLIPSRYKATPEANQVAALCFALALAPAPFAIISRDVATFTLNLTKLHEGEPQSLLLGESILNAFRALRDMPEEVNKLRLVIKKIIEEGLEESKKNKTNVVKSALELQITALRKESVHLRADIETAGFMQNLIVLLQDFCQRLEQSAREL